MMNQFFSYRKLNDNKFGISLDCNLNELTKTDFLEIGNIFLNELLVVCNSQTISARKFASICYSWGAPKIFDTSKYSFESDKDRKTLEKVGMRNIPGLVKICAYKDEENDHIGVLSDDELPWHSDGGGFLNPPEVIALYAVEIGDNNHTDFLECATPYEKLSSEDKKVVDSLEYVHVLNVNSSFSYYNEIHNKPINLFNADNQQEIKLPLITTSPGGHRGFRYNYLSFLNFVDKTEKESTELKKWIESIIFKEENVYTHHWKPGDVIFMDQTVMLHRRRKQDFSKRLLYRFQYDVSKLLCSRN